MLLDFSKSGDLPVGVHQASLDETLARFATGTSQQIQLGLRLKRKL
jgi:hypothetical protein